MERDFKIVEIIKNFDEEFQKYSNDKTGPIKQYFLDNQVKEVKELKYKDYKGFGEMKKGKINGKVVMHFLEQNYIGDYQNNQKNGYGYHGFKNCYYVGKYVEDKKVDGIVYSQKDDSIIYTGGWGDDTYHGYGELNRLNGQKYRGNFEYGSLHGQGKLTYLNGDYYEGQFQDNKRDGVGKYVRSNGDYYEGEFKNNLFNGKGKYYWTSGEFFKGEFIDGQMGEGEMDFQNGVIASGMFKESRKNINFDLKKIEIQINFYNFTWKGLKKIESILSVPLTRTKSQLCYFQKRAIQRQEKTKILLKSSQLLMLNQLSIMIL